VLCMSNHPVKNTVSHGIWKEYESITAWDWHQVHIFSS
jgi:hypothetical protein